MKQNKNMIVQFLVLMLFSLPVQAVNIALLKGTTGIAPEGYDPVWGLSMWEEGITKQLYNLSAKQMKKNTETSLQNQVTQIPLTPEQQANKTNVLQILSAQKNTATENLIAQMFHESGGTFNVTNAPNNPVRQFTPEHLGNILKIVSENKPNMQELLKNYLVQLNLKNSDGKLFKSSDYSQFLNGLVGAVKECSVANADRIYPENTAQNIVLGYLLAKSNTRQDLQDYLSAVTGKPVTLPDEQYSKQDFAKNANQAPDLTNIQSFADFACASVYQQKYASPLPKVVENNKVQYQNQDFPDCVETTIRNLCNIATYGAQDQTLGQVPKDVAMSSGLQEFYSQSLHQNPAEVGNKAVHQGWVDLVENMPGMIYSRLLTGSAQTIIGDQCDGVIPVASVDATLPSKTVTIGGKDYQVQEKKVGGKTYWLVPKDSGLICYELVPTASNIIVALNNLFNLHLYQSTDDVLQPDFAQKHFESMCTKLGWTISKNEMQKVIDLEQGKSRSVDIAVSIADGAQFKINLITKAHGFVSVDAANNVGVAIAPKTISVADGKTQAACVALGVVHNDNLHSLKPGSACYKLIANPDERMNLIKSLMKDQTSMDQNESYLTRLIISMGDLSDPHYQDAVLESIADLQAISQPIAQALVVMASVAAVKYNYPEINVKYCQILQKGTMDQSDMQEFFELMLNKHSFIDSLLNKGLINSENVASILPLVDQGMKDDQYGLQRRKYLDVIQHLIDKGLINAENVASILSLINPKIRDYARGFEYLNIVKGLINKGLINAGNVNSILSWTNSVMVHEDDAVRFQCVNVVKSLIDKGLVNDENVDFVLRFLYSYDHNYSIKSKILDATKVFFGNNANSVLSWVNQGLQDRKSFNFAESVMNQLINVGLINVANANYFLSLADQGMKYQDSLGRYLDVIKSLIDAKLINAENVNHVLLSVDQGMNDRYYRVQSKTLDVIKGLIDRDLINYQQAWSLLDKLKTMKVSDRSLDVEIVNLKNKLLATIASKPVQPLVPKVKPEIANIADEEGFSYDKLLSFIASKQAELPEPESDNQSIVKQRQQQEQERLQQDRLRQAELNRDQNVDPTDQPDVVR
ncbi:hypothetical protein A3J41_03255 [candidate division TM6 bacterium RIFCSPHIGHO2_12_FULL_38_8]|nr:MAG: hypothetical protein A3J41_03255 [candidate division TM6 bacterium RIFCSPHIGHO2_12_FULL_38_8]